MKTTRLEKSYTLKQLESETGIALCYLSLLERGFYRARQKTKEKIEKVLGTIDWLETGKLNIQSANFYKATILVEKLVALTISMNQEDREKIKEFLHKYFLKKGGR